MKGKLRLSSAGIRAAALNSPKVRDAVAARADAMAASLTGAVLAHDRVADITRDSHTTDRAVEGVTIAHAGGVGLEAEYGYLAEAAAAAGLSRGGKK